MRASEPIKLRWKKLDDGRESAFLDITIPDRPRKKEYLRIYRGGSLSRKETREAERLALAICEKRLQDYNALRMGVHVFKERRLVKEYWAQCAALRSEATRRTWDTAWRHFDVFVARRGYRIDCITMGDIDAAFCKEWLLHLTNDAEVMFRNRGKEVNCKHGCRQKSSKTNISTSTAVVLFNVVKVMLGDAVKDGIIATNPALAVKLPKVMHQKREYLTVEEFRRLADAERPHDALCRAFLFSCIMGLRVSDVAKLRWEDVSVENGDCKINFVQKKTRGEVYLDVPQLAVGYMGERGSGLVFTPIPRSMQRKEVLTKWMEAAGITKHITFHNSRHTAAVLLLTSGASIYTVQRILGHSSLQSTQVYADIVDATKKEAMCNLERYIVNGCNGAENGASPGTVGGQK